MPTPTPDPQSAEITADLTPDDDGAVTLGTGPDAVRFHFTFNDVVAFEQGGNVSSLDYVADATRPRLAHLRAAVAACARDPEGRPVDFQAAARRFGLGNVHGAVLAALLDEMRRSGFFGPTAPSEHSGPEEDAA